MSADLDDIRARWVSLRSQYEQFGDYMVASLKTRIRRTGITCSMTTRTKTVDSFLKKIIRKRLTNPLEEMHDKVGVRIIVPFVSQLEQIDPAIKEQFDVRKFENKSEGLGKDKFAYQSWHYDLILKDPIPENAAAFRGLWCEVQLRTECQHLWAEMAHRIMYKTEQPVPESDARRVHRLNALLEIADYEFESTRDSMLRQPGAWGAQVVVGLEGLYYELTGGSFDRELSLEVLDCLQSLCPRDPASILAEVREWVERHRGEIESVMEQYKESRDRILFLFQPEALLLLTLLDKDRFSLLARWTARFPEDQLTRLATAFGRSMD